LFENLSLLFFAVFITAGIFFAAAIDADDTATTTAALDFDINQISDQAASTSTASILPPADINATTTVSDFNQLNQNENPSAQNINTDSETETEAEAEQGRDRGNINRGDRRNQYGCC